MAAWSLTATNAGRLSVQTSAALSGSYGLHASLVNRNQMYVADITPSVASVYNARFVFDPNSVTIGSGKVHDLFHGLDAGARTALTVQIRAATGGYQVRVGSLLRSGSTTYSSWWAITDSPHTMEIGWQAASTQTGNNGAQRLWIDGTLRQAQTTLANGTTRLEEARLGPQVIPTGVAGTEYFDAFVSTLGTFIGI